MKPVLITVTLILWVGYAIGHDRKPVPRRYHYAIHAIYAVCLIGAVVL
jgi:hypothetical protein